MRLPLIIAVAVLLAGCGAEPKPEKIARDYVASTNPDKCDYVDLEFLERLTERRGKAARRACRDATMRFRPPQDVKVGRSEVKGNRAEVELVASGQDITVRLERREDRWLVSGLGP